MIQREGLIKELEAPLSWNSVDILADFILARERALIERVEKPLKEVHSGYGSSDSVRVKEALRIIEQAKVNKPVCEHSWEHKEGHMDYCPKCHSEKEPEQAKKGTV